MKFTIGSKLLVGFGTVLVLMVVSAGLSFRKSMDIKEIEHFIFSRQLSSIQAADRLMDDLDYSGSKGRQAILVGSQPATKRGQPGKVRCRVEQDRKDPWPNWMNCPSIGFIRRTKTGGPALKKAYPRCEQRNKQ